jgi:SET domain-containing protein
MIHPETFVQRTHKGLGLFAGRDFKRGEILWIVDDHDIKIPLETYEALDEQQRQKLNIYSYMDVRHRVIVPWDEGKYVNHDCEPNSTGLSEFDNISIALRDIEAGEEIVEDYRCYFGHFETFQCQCGSTSCRGQISSDQPYEADLRIGLQEIADTIKSHDQCLLNVEAQETKEFLQILSNAC